MHSTWTFIRVENLLRMRFSFKPLAMPASKLFNKNLISSRRILSLPMFTVCSCYFTASFFLVSQILHVYHIAFFTTLKVLTECKALLRAAFESFKSSSPYLSIND